MLEAAHERFCEQGYTGARMTDIAAAAGVAVQTLYFTFHTKAELLRACYGRAVLGPDELPPDQQPWYAAALAAPTAAAALAHFAAGDSAIAARVGLLDAVVRSATHEPDAVAVRARSEQLRREGYRAFLAEIDRRHGLALDLDTATDVLLTLCGTGPYRSLVLDYGWAYDTFVEWLSRMLAAALLNESVQKT